MHSGGVPADATRPWDGTAVEGRTPLHGTLPKDDCFVFWCEKLGNPTKNEEGGPPEGQHGVGMWVVQHTCPKRCNCTLTGDVAQNVLLL